jgi:UDP-N-acetylmuramoyl-tripeptide--D-alanyl-D-alanine ligase
MIPLSLGHLAAATGATLDRITDVDAMVTAPLSFDSRDIAPGGLFACLPGRHTDGHDYAAQAVAAGATAVLATRPCRLTGICCCPVSRHPRAGGGACPVPLNHDRLPLDFDCWEPFIGTDAPELCGP